MRTQCQNARNEMRVFVLMMKEILVNEIANNTPE